jgi:hypothetical protein
MRTIFILISAACIFVFIWFLGNWQNPFRVPIIKTIKICDVYKPDGSTNFTCPPGSNFTLAIGIKTNTSNQLTGAAAVELICMDNSNDVIVFNMENSISSNWLDRKGFHGFLLASSNRQWNLDNFLASDRSYRLTWSALNTNCSFWLSYTKK